MGTLIGRKAVPKGKVSIQLMSPASGNFYYKVYRVYFYCSSVSIQLMSPASGNLNEPALNFFTLMVSIQLMSPASGNLGAYYWAKTHAIDVSIQLMSPASGNC